jgi:hypothetical protein
MSTGELSPAKEFVGQDRALAAMELGWGSTAMAIISMFSGLTGGEN